MFLHSSGTAPGSKLAFPVTTLHTTHHRGSIRPQGRNSRCRQQSGETYFVLIHRRVLD